MTLWQLSALRLCFAVRLAAAAPSSAEKAWAFANAVKRGDSLRRVLHVSYGTKWVQPHCLSLYTAVAHGIKPIVLGMRRQAQFDALGPLDKLYALDELTRDIGALPKPPTPAIDPLLVFNDGYDVAFMGGAAAIERRFERMGAPLVFAGERGCCTSFFWMHQWRNDCISPRAFPRPSSALAARDPTNRWVNSGLIAGTRHAFRAFIVAALEERERKLRDWGSEKDTYRTGTDQLIVCELLSQEAVYHNASALRAARIDYGSELFQCMYRIGADGTVISRSGPPRAAKGAAKGAAVADREGTPVDASLAGAFRLAPRSALNTLTKSSPLLLHFNGDSPGKGSFDSFVRAQWWGDSPMELIDAALVFDYDHGAARRFGEICPRSVFTPPLGARSTWVDPRAARRERAALRARLVVLYERVDPAMVAKVDAIVERYRGNATRLFRLLAEKYPAEFASRAEL